jgi:hypothetical protein
MSAGAGRTLDAQPLSHPFVRFVAAVLRVSICAHSAVAEQASRRLRRPLAVLLLLAYAIYGLVEAFEYQLWWLALVPVAALAAGIGVALRARWGTLTTYAISILFVMYWLWGVITAALGGVFQSRPPLQAGLMLVPGIAFGLLAGFCCYACRPPATQSA